MKKLIKILLVSVFWLFIWQLFTWIVGKELLLPSPVRVLVVLRKLILSGEFWQSISFSIARVLLGIFLALLFGTALAVLTSHHSLLRSLVAPMVTVVRSTPVASFILLLWLWLGSDNLPAVICLLMVFPIAWSAGEDAIAAFDKELMEVGKVYRFSFLKKMKYFYLPSYFPYFLSACKTSVGLAWKAAVAAEILVVSPHSIGKHLYNAKIYLETPELFAWTLVVIILSLLIESLATVALKKVGKQYAWVTK